MSEGWTFADLTLWSISLRTVDQKDHQRVHTPACIRSRFRYSRQNGAALWRSFEALQNEVRKRLLFAGGWVTLGGETI
jgi:hypothetical protein